MELICIDTRFERLYGVNEVFVISDALFWDRTIKYKINFLEICLSKGLVMIKFQEGRKFDEGKYFLVSVL